MSENTNSKSLFDFMKDNEKPTISLPEMLAEKAKLEIPEEEIDSKTYLSNILKKHIPLPLVQNPATEFYYKTDNKKMGLALVFNHTIFKGASDKPRAGTDIDNTTIMKSLKKYGFEVRPFENYDGDKIEATLKEVSQEDHSDYDCFVCVVMTHGKLGEISAFDRYYKVDKLWTPFFGDSCASLINKPKLFFIQACRGTGLEKPIVYKDGHTPGRISYSNQFLSESNIFTIPSSADILVMYSCFEGNASTRNPKTGSWFIQDLSFLLDYFGNVPSGIELYHLLTALNQKLAYEHLSYSLKPELNQKKQMPTFTSTLTKLFILKPKVEC